MVELVQREYEINGKVYRFTEQFKGYIRMDVDKRLDPKKDFRSWKDVEEFCQQEKNRPSPDGKNK